MIHIMHILTDSNFGGAGRYLINYLKHSNRADYRFTVVLPERSLLIPEIAPLDIPVLEVAGIGECSFSVEATRALRKVIRELRPDIVHTHGSFSGRIAAKLCGRKIVYTRHCAFPVPEYLKKGPGHIANGFINQLFSNQIIAVSPAAAENLTEAGISEKRITIMMNGSEVIQRDSVQKQMETKRRLEIPEGVFVAGILARLESYKGHMLLLEAAKTLAEEKRDFRILIGGSGTEEAHIREKIHEYGLEDKVLLLGFVQNVASILSILDVQLNCSYGTETSSISIIEGMSMGIPTIASNYGGNPWLIDDKTTGLLFQNLDSEDLTVQIRRLMDDRTLLRRMQENALAAYHSRFTGEIFAKNIESVYEKTLGETGGSYE